MQEISYEKIIPLIYKVEVSEDSVSCHFVCPRVHKEIISIVNIEPKQVAHTITFFDYLIHPFRSWGLRHHMQSNIYGDAVENNLVVEAFEKIANHFKWNAQYNSFVYE